MKDMDYDKIGENEWRVEDYLIKRNPITDKWSISYFNTGESIRWNLNRESMITKLNQLLFKSSEGTFGLRGSRMGGGMDIFRLVEMMERAQLPSIGHVEEAPVESFDEIRKRRIERKYGKSGEYRAPGVGYTVR